MSINRFAGMGGHQSSRSQTDEWLTPPDIIAALGPFDLDPCAPVVRPWPTAAAHLTIEDNGLLRRWAGRVWLNPPYSHPGIGRWLGRMAAHGRGTALIFARTETEHFCRWVWEAATALLFVKGRINFHRVDGSRSDKNSGAPVVLCAYGFDDADRLADSGIDGRFVPLLLPVTVAFPPLADGRTWRDVVRDVMSRAGRPIRLDELYIMLRGHPKAAGNRHVDAKVRQTLQRGPFRRLDRGLWEVEPC